MKHDVFVSNNNIFSELNTYMRGVRVVGFDTHCHPPSLSTVCSFWEF